MRVVRERTACGTRRALPETRVDSHDESFMLHSPLAPRSTPLARIEQFAKSQRSPVLEAAVERCNFLRNQAARRASMHYIRAGEHRETCVAFDGRRCCEPLTSNQSRASLSLGPVMGKDHRPSSFS
jgi:hypothetical protein